MNTNEIEKALNEAINDEKLQTIHELEIKARYLYRTNQKNEYRQIRKQIKELKKPCTKFTQFHVTTEKNTWNHITTYAHLRNVRQLHNDYTKINEVFGFCKEHQKWVKVNETWIPNTSNENRNDQCLIEDETDCKIENAKAKRSPFCFSCQNYYDTYGG